MKLRFIADKFQFKEISPQIFVFAISILFRNSLSDRVIFIPQKPFVLNLIKSEVGNGYGNEFLNQSPT